MHCSGGLFDLEKSHQELKNLKEKSNDPDLWNDTREAQKLMKEISALETPINAYEKMQNLLSETLMMFEMAEQEEDAETMLECEKILGTLQKDAKIMETECLFSGEADANDCFIEIHSGAGGTESNDWSSILLRMYLRWADSHSFKCEIIDEVKGEEAGIKSVTVKVSGNKAYGWCKTESGVHRLVRISPFNAAGKRMTSFSSVWVYPVVDDEIKIEILDKDLKIDTYRASGAGGQHVNTTDSAVRITHIPTNIVVQCQNDRSQHKNRAEAMSMLKSRLYEMELKKKEDAIQDANASKTDNSWGHQIRSYVLQPYQMVKDLRTGFEMTDSKKVLDGALDGFMSASLAQKVIKK